MEKDEISKGLRSDDLADSRKLEANVEGTCDENGAKLTQCRSRAVHGLPKGFTYFVRDDDMIKIGSSMRPLDRVSALQTGSSRPLETLAIVSQEIAAEFETHQLFAHLRVRGEWFRADRELLYFIEGLNADVAAAPETEPEPAVAPRAPAMQSEAMIRRLHALRKAYGAQTAMGHTISNILKQMDGLRTYVRPEWATDERQTLPYMLNYQLQRYERLKAAAN